VPWTPFGLFKGDEVELMNRGEITDIWNKAVGVVTGIYYVTEHYPDKELPGFANHMKKMAFSMANSMAEGASKKNLADILQCISGSQSAAVELASQLKQASSMKHLEPKERLLGEIDGISDALHKLSSGWRGKDEA
jgi:four helix bundle protein